MTAAIAQPEQSTAVALDPQRKAQAAWSATSLTARLRVLRKARSRLTARAAELVGAMPAHLSRTHADSYAAEILPLLAACKFLEQQAPAILKSRSLSSRGRPLWLTGVYAVVERVPFGIVLVIAASNYPLFLAGVQTLQALAAGNAVIWKPGLGGRAVAEFFASALAESGLPDGLLRLTGESTSAGVEAIHARPDKIVFTGSAETGREILRMAAEFAIPVVAELSGCDMAVVLPSANERLVLDALCFGMRLNGSCTCMAPRRLMLVGDAHERLLLELRRRFAGMPGVAVSVETRRKLWLLLHSAEQQGAVVHGDEHAALLKPLLIEDGDASMEIAQADIFAPIIIVVRARNSDAVVEMDRLCPFGLTAAIFGDEPSARSLGKRLNVGTVTINDLIVPTADPRVPFGGRRGSGFGVTRGAEGLLEMTSAKTIAVRRRPALRQYEATDERHEALFAGVVELGHAPGIMGKLRGLGRVVTAATRFKGPQAGSGREQ